MRAIRPLGNHLVVQQLDPVRHSGSIQLMSTLDKATPAKVLAVGRDVYGVAVGDVVLVEGFRSGIELEGRTDLRHVSDEIVVGVVEP